MRKALRNASLPGQSAGDAGSGKVALQWGLAEFTVDGAVILLGDPGLGGEVQLLEGEVLLAFEHGEQAPFDATPRGVPACH